MMEEGGSLCDKLISVVEDFGRGVNFLLVC